LSRSRLLTDTPEPPDGYLLMLSGMGLSSPRKKSSTLRALRAPTFSVIIEPGFFFPELNPHASNV
jgi:hypothetical protein